MTADAYRTRLAPWAGWIGSALAVALNHQGLADAIYFDCTLGNRVSGPVVGLVSLLIAWTGAAISWRSRSAAGGPPELRTRYFIAVVGVLLTGIYTLTIVFLVLATVIIPTCAR